MKTSNVVAYIIGALFAISSKPADSYNPSQHFSFVVYLDNEPWTYNSILAEDELVILPPESPWRCRRRRIYQAPDGETTGTFQCTSDGGKTWVFNSATCGVEPGETHSTVDLATLDSQISLHANCITVPTRREWFGF